MICFCYFCHKKLLLVVQIGPEKQFLEVLPNFFGTTALQQKLLILIESPNIFHWKSTKKESGCGLRDKIWAK